MAKKPKIPRIDDLDREQANLSDGDLDALLAGSLSMGGASAVEAFELESGEEVEGSVIGSDGDDVLIEFGKNTGAIPKDEFHGEVPESGTRIKATYRRFDATREVAVLSVSEVIRDLFWREAQIGMVVEGRVIDVNRGGLVLLIKNERAFMPISQIDLEHVEDANIYRDQTLECEITAIDNDRAELVVSRKRLLKEREDDRRMENIDRFEVGRKVDGTVRRVNEHGAFIDVGGIDGLLHSSKLRRARDVIGDGPKVGDRLRVEIVHVDTEQGRIGLDIVREELSSGGVTLARTSDAEVTTDLEVGESVTALVSRIREEGAFLLLDDGLEGLIPADQLEENPVKPGNVVQAEIVAIDLGKRRVTLKRS